MAIHPAMHPAQIPATRESKALPATAMRGNPIVIVIRTSLPRDPQRF
jgi:hypothetical protein